MYTYNNLNYSLFNAQNYQLTSDIGIIGWVESLPFPTHYSKTTTEAIQKGVYTKSARTEIVNAISTRIMDHTMTPTSVEYTKLCARLISVYPNSADTVGNRYVSLINQRSL